MAFFRTWRERFGKLTLHILWDLFMVWVALINLFLISFDLTYLMLRPTYHRWVPIVVRIYDPVLGIEPHALTDELLKEAKSAHRLLELDPESVKLDEQLAQLSELTARVLIVNPFQRSGQTYQLEIIRVAVARATGMTSLQLRDPEVARRAARDFWSGSLSVLHDRFDLFDESIAPGLAVNYHREYDLSGHLEDHFWMIDLPFLILFWIEFNVRWYLALRRKTYARWFFFPIFNWYDVLGLIPMAIFRPFRLLRVVSMYMRLRRSELSSVGKDYLSRTVAYVSNIITEEVSDRVALRILDEFAEEISDGTHRRIVHSTIISRRDEIEQVFVDQIRQLLTDTATLTSFRDLLRLNLETAVQQAQTLRDVPLPNAVLRPVVRTIGEIVLDTTFETIQTTLDSEDGQAATRAVASSVIDLLFEADGLDEAESLARDITLHVIEHMKETVAVRKWALPETDGTPRITDDVLDALLTGDSNDTVP